RARPPDGGEAQAGAGPVGRQLHDLRGAPGLGGPPAAGAGRAGGRRASGGAEGPRGSGPGIEPFSAVFGESAMRPDEPGHHEGLTGGGPPLFNRAARRPAWACKLEQQGDIMRRFIAAVAAVAARATTAASADTYPSRPVTVIVPFAAGGPTDIVARIVAEYYSKTLGQQFIVENI